ncbi:hypothetical protein [Lysobacter hankyongensis]|uniref:Uncharacterized protein n=1 Tax=Lysobacter hankyongensis TaxID=1176535 RepID=A0ABP9C1M7_9GAMM
MRMTIPRSITIAIVAATMCIPLSAPAGSILGGCRFDTTTLRFAGTPEAQTVCLLRKVKPKGSGAVVQPIPPWLLARVGKPIDLEVVQVQRYLDRNAIGSADLGGPLASGDASTRRYFVIHDTSSPELPNASAFPVEIDLPGHWTNRLTGWDGLSNKVNLIISRDGRSRTFLDWAADRPRSATKVEVQFNAARRVFVHVENIQVRMKPPGSWAWRAPDPGFGAAQTQRLALAYIVASLRAGRWLIPAYHFNIDEGIPDGHDDPQNVDLADWVSRAEQIERQIRE